MHEWAVCHVLNLSTRYIQSRKKAVADRLCCHCQVVEGVVLTLSLGRKANRALGMPLVNLFNFQCYDPLCQILRGLWKTSLNTLDNLKYFVLLRISLHSVELLFSILWTCSSTFVMTCSCLHGEREQFCSKPGTD